MLILETWSEFWSRHETQDDEQNRQGERNKDAMPRYSLPKNQLYFIVKIITPKLDKVYYEHKYNNILPPGRCLSAVRVSI